MTHTANPNTGHGHVRPRPDGVRARCGGPAMCRVCQQERAALDALQSTHPADASIVGAQIDMRDSVSSAAPVVAFDDPRVQVVYDILCNTDDVPPPEQHWEGWAARRIVDALAAPAPAQAEPVAPDAGKWEGAEEWMPLAWELCADECGEESCTELVWEGGPIPEPWGDRWLKYEDEAKRLIALVRKCLAESLPTPPAAAAPLAQPLTDKTIFAEAEAFDNEHAWLTGFYEGARFAERAHGIKGQP